MQRKIQTLLLALVGAVMLAFVMLIVLMESRLAPRVALPNNDGNPISPSQSGSGAKGDLFFDSPW